VLGVEVHRAERFDDDDVVASVELGAALPRVDRGALHGLFSAAEQAQLTSLLQRVADRHAAARSAR
jgi:hypothetical protein